MSLRRPRRRLALLVAALVAASAAGPASPPTAAVSTTVVVSQVYGGGGNTGATLRNDFVELYNRGSGAVSLAGWSVQYASAAGTTWQVTPLSGTLAPGAYFLVQQASGGGGTAYLPTPGAVGTVNLAASAGKVALLTTTTPATGACPSGAIDLVGYGSTATCAEGAPAPAPSTTTAILRRAAGATDTDANAADFVAGTPVPRTSAPDVTPPVATAPTMALRAGVALAGSALQASVAWSGADEGGGSGLAAFEVQAAPGGGAWAGVATGGSLATSVATTLAAGASTEYRVRAVDRAGNAGAWTAGGQVTGALVQEDAAAVTYGGTWTTVTDAALSGGAGRWASTAGASATITVTGGSVALVTTRGPGRGAVDLYVDGTLVGRLDTYAKTTTHRVQAWSRSWATPGDHTIRLVVVGTKGRPRVDLDALGVLATSVPGTITGTPLGLLAALPTAAEAGAGYDRALFVHWVDDDGDGCDTRREVLAAESLTAVTIGAGCSLAGGSWLSAYDGITSGDPAAISIDHVVALKEAWDSGAWGWTAARRRAFANDLGVAWSLRAVTTSVNSSKSDLDPAQWLPPVTSFRCTYATEWVAVKTRWALAVDGTERLALADLLAGCAAAQVTVPLALP